MFRRRPVQVVVLTGRVVQLANGAFEAQDPNTVVSMTRREALDLIERGRARWPKEFELQEPVEPIDA